MRCMVDYDYTTRLEKQRVLDDLREFKERYTEGDLLRKFYSETDNVDVTGDVVYFKVYGFPGGTYYNNATHFRVEALLEGFRKIYKVRFYCDLEMNIDTRTVPTKMYDFERYELVPEST